MKKLPINSIVLLALALAAITATCLAQGPKDSVAVAASKEEIAKQVTELSKLNEHHKLLASTIGTWSFVGKHSFPNPTIKPVEFKGTAVKKEMCGGRYFITETTGEKIRMLWSDGQPVEYKATLIEGYDNVKCKFVTAEFSNESGTGIFTMEGNYDSLANAITYESETVSHMHKDIPPGTIMKIFVVVRLIDKDHFILERREIVDGKEIIKTELKYTRV